MADYIPPARAEYLIKYYFIKNCTYNKIVAILEKKHNIETSLSSLKRFLSMLGLKRKKFEESDLEDIVYAIVEELHGAGYNLGYRSPHEKLKTVWELEVKRDTVYLILSIADPEGISDRAARKLRRRQFHSRGSNFAWSMDGYDKLKALSLPIHGCIDAFSRKILWLEVGTTNNDPRVTAHHYLETVKKLKCVPIMQFCFGLLIKKDLRESKLLWNQHLIRKQSSKGVTHGRPFFMYNPPERFGSKDYRKPVDLDAVDRLLRKYTKEPQLYDPLFAEVAYSLIPELKTPVDADEALQLYKKLLCMINTQLNDEE
ncbi:hypothetical protein QAD02_012415 [Eretmocerus hayati]|uniref:Uncharacterized protein n=1 Tax=Eretmocerus hayati TaxID=131215 RepID=A0ACC2NZP1_9HYME|nr:hypothetical protein QAD02_012415 [Eretmocerus hayati]